MSSWAQHMSIQVFRIYTIRYHDNKNEYVFELYPDKAGDISKCSIIFQRLEILVISLFSWIQPDHYSPRDGFDFVC